MTIPWKDSVILAPLTKGGNLPFRRLCADFGAPITISEMAYARFVAKGEGRELALLRKHPSEQCFGVQIATNSSEEGAIAAKVAQERGAQFIDLNCGCPIHDTTRRGLGSALLRNPTKLGRLVEELAKKISLPLSVKIRLGWSEDAINVRELAAVVENSGAVALTIHGRTREQRYSKAADWQMIGELAGKLKIPVIGNGDILTHYEAATRKSISGVAGIMIGRGALIKPWIFQEIRESKELCLTAEQRVEIYFRLTKYFKEHFREDEKGKKRTMFFLPWHFSFFHRYRPFPQAEWDEQSKIHPLIQTRSTESKAKDPLDIVLESGNELIHQQIAEILWNSASDAEAAGQIAKIEIVPEAEADGQDSSIESVANG